MSFPSLPYFHQDCAYAVNQQIQISMRTMYFYVAMAAHYQNLSVALPGVHKFAENFAYNHLKQANFYIQYQNKRGALKAVLPQLESPSYTFGSALHAMQSCFNHESSVYNNLVYLRGTAGARNDYEMAQMVEHKLTVQFRLIKYIGDFISQLTRAGEGIGEFYFDYQLEQQVEEDKGRFKDLYKH